MGALIKLAEVDFYGQKIQAGLEDGRVHVVIKRICEFLGLNYSSQLQKLKEKPWAVMVNFAITASDGKRYEMSTIELDALPMWLATIDLERIPDLTVRGRIKLYQKECAKVLRDYFFKTGAQSTKGDRPTAEAKAQIDYRAVELALKVAARSKTGVTADAALIRAVELLGGTVHAGSTAEVVSDHGKDLTKREGVVSTDTLQAPAPAPTPKPEPMDDVGWQSAF